MYRNKSCGLISGVTETKEKSKLQEEQTQKKLQEFWDGEKEKIPENYTECSYRDKTGCYNKDHGIQKYTYCLQCAQDSFWGPGVNRWGNAIIVRKNA